MSNIDKKNPSPSPRQEKCKILAAKALAQIETLGLDPVPQVYELWYRYYQNEPDVVRTLNKLDEKAGEDSFLKIHAQLFGDNNRQETFNKIGSQIQLSMTDLSQMITTARVSAGEFGTSLDGMAEKITAVNSADDLVRAMADLAAETQKMADKNSALEQQLGHSEQQINELKNNLDLVQREAMIDGLTDLVNRKTFDKNLRDCVDNAVKNNSPVVLMILDIDFFKKVNDTYGHAVGDRILRLVARTLLDNVKGRDTAARYGGEEFAIILPDTPIAAGMKVAEVLRRSVETKELINKTTQQNMGRITMSIGIAEYVIGESISQFIERTDAALYEAKKSGRNRVAAAQ